MLGRIWESPSHTRTLPTARACAAASRDAAHKNTSNLPHCSISSVPPSFQILSWYRPLTSPSDTISLLPFLAISPSFFLIPRFPLFQGTFSLVPFLLVPFSLADCSFWYIVDLVYFCGLRVAPALLSAFLLLGVRLVPNNIAK